MFTVSITVLRQHYPGLVDKLARVGIRLDPSSDVAPSPSTEEVNVTLQAETPSELEALKTWLDGLRPQDVAIQLRAGPHAVNMWRFCRVCQVQDDPTAGLQERLRPCLPGPSAKDYCPLVFTLQQAAEEGPPKSKRRKVLDVPQNT